MVRNSSGCRRDAPKIDDFLDLDLAILKRLGLNKPGVLGTLTWSLRGEEIGCTGISMGEFNCHLIYSRKKRSGEWQRTKETIRIDQTKAGFGGKRRWFICPRCERRCRVLYGDRRFYCRICRCAVYQSQYDPLFHACHARVRRIRNRLLDHSSKTWDPTPVRPKGMHVKTYESLVEGICYQQWKLDDAMLELLNRRGSDHLH